MREESFRHVNIYEIVMSKKDNITVVLVAAVIRK
jgi:hypothetical protein